MFRSAKLVIAALLTVGASLSVGCAGKKPIDYGRSLEDGKLALEKIQPADYPEFSFDQTQAASLSKASEYSIEYLKKTSSKTYFPYNEPSSPISHDRALATCVAFKALVDQQASSPMSKPDLNARIKQDFEVYRSIGGWNPELNDFSRTVLFTGYFTPIYDASLTPDGEYKYPLYKRPGDLLNDPEGITASRMVGPGKYELYYTRAEIEKGDVLKGQELVYLKSRWQAYVVAIQGSAKLRLKDGSILEVGYAGNNGWPAFSIARQLIADHKLTQEQLSLKEVSAYFASHPEDVDHYLDLNPRFIFFTRRPGGPFGCLNEPVTAFGTVATDKQVYPRAMPSFVQTQIPTAAGPATSYNSWLMDQDAGGAIRAAGRADIYIGGPEAEQIAGHQLYEGKFYYIAIKPDLVGKYLPAPAMPGKKKPAPVS